MKLYVIRHGETNYNIEYKICGISEAYLTDQGILQAKQAKDKLEGITFDKVLVSPLKRAIQTASIISDQTFIIDDRLQEINFGIFEGKSRDIQSFKSIKYNLGMHYPSGENFLEVIHRVYSLLDELKNSNYDNVLIVCHGGIIRAINSYFYDMSNDDFFNHNTKNCEIITYLLK